MLGNEASLERKVDSLLNAHGEHDAAIQLLRRDLDVKIEEVRNDLCSIAAEVQRPITTRRRKRKTTTEHRRPYPVPPLTPCFDQTVCSILCWAVRYDHNPPLLPVSRCVPWTKPHQRKHCKADPFTG
jgi:hypothetical protein